MEAIELTRNNNRMTLNLALSYSARWEITQAVKSAVASAAEGKVRPEDVTEEFVSFFLCTADMPDPKLMLRTRGEHRLSHFPLWKIPSSELFYTANFRHAFCTDVPH